MARDLGFWKDTISDDPKTLRACRQKPAALGNNMAARFFVSSHNLALTGHGAGFAMASRATKTSRYTFETDTKPALACCATNLALPSGHGHKTKAIVWAGDFEDYLIISLSEHCRGFYFSKHTISAISATHRKRLSFAFSDFITYIHFWRLIALLFQRNPAIS